MDRREFVRRTLGSAGALAMLQRLEIIFPELGGTGISHRLGIERIAQAATSDFVILYDDDPIPPSVQPPQYNWPRVCGVEGTDPLTSRIVYSDLPTPQDLAAQGGFTVYELNPAPPGTSLEEAALFEDETARTFGGRVSYTQCDAAGICEPTIQITADLYYYHPHPIMIAPPPSVPGASQNSNEDGIEELIQTNALPTPGYVIASLHEYQMYWIENGVLYYLIADRALNPDYLDLISRLVPA